MNIYVHVQYVQHVNCREGRSSSTEADATQLQQNHKWFIYKKHDYSLYSSQNMIHAANSTHGFQKPVTQKPTGEEVLCVAYTGTSWDTHDGRTTLTKAIVSEPMRRSCKFTSDPCMKSTRSIWRQTRSAAAAWTTRIPSDGALSTDNTANICLTRHKDLKCLESGHRSSLFFFFFFSCERRNYFGHCLFYK